MDAVKVKVIMRIVICVGMCYWICFLYYNRPLRIKGVSIEPGVPFTFVSNDNYYCNNIDFSYHDGLLYLLFGDKGVLKIYDNQGVYIVSFALSLSKGQSRILQTEEYLFVCDGAHNLYVFSGTEFKEYHDSIDYQQYINLVEITKVVERADTTGASYYLRQGAVYKQINQGNEELIINRPLLSILFFGFTPFCLLFILVLLSLIGNACLSGSFRKFFKK